ncbi:hypothetical protein [Streptomyces sp. NBC_01190]|uniref:hypothetical protein n=1 Tax=Streptomyces sp. NBC_01190 TaxID=2903767 RepID=UPI00386DC52C|nr:hypothetical protein OG519_18150 [Streptomyces sp. NBC_01190]
MSSRSVTLSASVVAAAVCGALLIPAAASAAPKASGLTVAVGDVVRGPLTRGHGEDSFTVTVTNTTDIPQAYTGYVSLLPTGGPSPLAVGQVPARVEPLSAPATDSAVRGQAPGLFAEFFPHGGSASRDQFQVPAKSSYRWKVTFGFAADYPGNDDGLDVDVNGSSTPVHFDLPPALPDGKLTDHFTQAATVSPGRPGQTTLETKNGAGGSFTSPLSTLVEARPAGTSGHGGVPLAGLQLEVRTGNGPWQKARVIVAGSEWSLPAIPAGFAYRQERDFQLRFTLAAGPGNPKSAQDLGLSATTWIGNPITSAQTVLHYRPASSAASTPPSPVSATPAPTSPAASSAATSAAAAAPAASATPSTPAASSTPPPAATGRLAHTGASHSGLFAGLAVALAAAGAALIAVVNRRRRTAG